jgi:hypothetical protein
MLHNHGSIPCTSFAKEMLPQKKTAPLRYTLRKSGSSAWHSSSVSWTNSVQIQTRKILSSGTVCSYSRVPPRKLLKSLKLAHGRIPPHSFQCRITHSLTPRRYNLCRVLADSRSRFQSSLSLTLTVWHRSFTFKF